MTSTPPQLQSPSDYMVGATIGEGSFGNVVIGMHKGSKLRVAIKVLLKHDVEKRPSLRHVIVQEQRILAQCNEESPFIVSLYASFHDTQCLYLVMELCERGTLTQAICSYRNDNNKLKNDKEWRTRVVSYYVHQIVQALEYLHFQQHVIHADLKPDNILISNNEKKNGPTVKLCDFGSAILLTPTNNSNSSDGNEHVISSYPSSSAIIPRGTAEYAAPELIRNDANMTPAIDLWSLGCIVICMMNDDYGGASPFHAQSDALCIDKIMTYCKQYNEHDYYNDEVWKDVAVEWKCLVKQLLHPDPLQRGNSKTIQSQYTQLWQTSNTNVNEDDTTTQRYLPPRPSWWNEAQSTPMRDGSQGWTAFVID